MIYLIKIKGKKMGNIIDFKKFYNEKNKEEKNTKYKTNTINFVDEQAKDDAEIFIGDEFYEPVKRLRAVMDNYKANSILLRLFQLDDEIKENATLSQINETGLFSQAQNSATDINRELDKEEQTEIICDYLEILNNFSNYSANALGMLQNMSDKLNSLVKLTYGFYLEEIASIPDFNESAELIYNKITSSSEFDKTFDTLFFDTMLTLNNEDNCIREDFKYFKESVEMFHQKLSNDFPGMHPSIYDSCLVYRKVINRKMDEIRKTSRILFTICDEYSEITPNSHYNVSFERNEIEELKRMFDNVDKKHYKDLTQYDSRLFSTNLKFATDRLNNTNQDEIIMDTQEIEAQLLYNIITTAPHQLKPFVEYFEKTNLVLPLAHDRVQFYLPDLANVTADDKKLNKLFCIELSDEKLDASAYRKNKPVVENIKLHAKNKKAKHNNASQSKQKQKNKPTKNR